VARAFIAGCLATWALLAQQPPADQKKLKTPPPKAAEEEPPDEDESLKPKEYTLNPLQAAKEITAGDTYFKVKRNYRAAARRYIEATKWDPGSAVAFLKLGEAEEKLRDRPAAREAYTKYLALAPDARNADEIKKKIAKWPAPAAK
jgi:tetratricopeptide (TPR) repeat protein